MNAITQIKQLFEQYGHATYDEACSQIYHAEQCATLAKENGYDQATQIAAFLHDIGHFVAQSQNNPDFTPQGYSNHGDLGADHLTQLGFDRAVTMLVRKHVDAKRYLVSMDEKYYQTLSPASQLTLTRQGGKMSSEELAAFSKLPELDAIIALRRFDDLGKDPSLAVLPSSYWFSQIEAYLAN
ncbi:HD domain-containing protein [Pseudoalteromonas galatheae]|uniref:HD domain-containing protein n=1 Tax=Pseudoalteromonas galatheae TaxID=579562 RepID=UPI0030D3DA54